ncbi:MAG: aminotransferase class I/II-fold pyridoxal phosphate-dependent enzyme [Alphaproteobacteria bacterium]|nr:aminotransferase class I/II-fold pyridoxal phosphate-dependent enzyme [Alphaproteobacteria bacterium]
MAIKASRRGRIAPFIVMDVMAAANARVAAGHDVVHLEVGQPSTAAPAGVIEAAARALESERLGYTEALGVPELRRAIADDYRARYGVAVDAGRIAVTAGSSGAFVLAFLAAFDAGDRVAFATPGYPGYRNILAALDVEPVPLAAERADGFQPTVDLLSALPYPPDGLILASPANPTGSMLVPDDIRRLVGWCATNGVRVISDEIYHGITYGKPAVTLADLTPSAIVINSFSKYYSMTGWRLGWMVVPPDLARVVECLAQNLFISPPTLSQHAACVVFACKGDLDANVRRYAENREVLLEGLPRCGFGPFAPADGAFYIYAGIGAFGGESPDIAREILNDAGVAVTPGLDFDVVRGKDYVRFSYAGSSDEMREAVRRLEVWWQRRTTAR